MDTQLLYTEASQLLENGLTKDAYIKFITAVELSTQQLHGVKFVHQTIVSTPAEYDKLLSIIRSSLTQLEHIVVQKSFINKTTVSTPPPPPLPPKPPVPPKPSISNKRPVPPLPPLAIVTTDLTLSTEKSTVAHRRPRASSSVTFADRRHTIPFMDDDEEEDDEEENIMNALKSIGTEKPSYPQRRIIHQPDRLSPSMTITNTTSNTTLEDAPCLMIDPYDLVPAQTHTAESMALPISPTCTTDFYVPNIPASPLLGMHRQLQRQLDLLLTQQQSLATSTTLWSEQEQQTASIATVRRLLNNVRTVYMSAMTVPTLLEFSPQLMAYQLTLIESAIFRAIPPEALQQHRAVAKQPHPNIVASTDFFNYLTRLIEHAILLPQEASHRAEIVHRWIKIATRCLSLNNYQTLKAIVSALGTPPVQRLKRTWECIPKKRMNRLEVLTALMSEADNYSQYRQHIRSLIPNCQPGRTLNQPMVPFLGVLIHDMTYVKTAKTTSGAETTTTATTTTATASTGDDPRVIEILNWMRTFQRCPPYSLRPPAHYIKKKNGFFVRQAQALQQYYTPSSKAPSSPTATVTSTPSTEQQGYFNMTPLTLASTHQSTTSDPQGADPATFLDSEDGIKVEQQRITHYILMRPWVNEKIIDELSQLREAPRRLIADQSLVRTNSYNSALNSHINNNNSNSNNNNNQTRSSAQRQVDSMTTCCSTTTTSSSAWDDIYTPEEHHPRRSFGSFWPWRKSSELVPPRQEPSQEGLVMARTPPPTPSRNLCSSVVANSAAAASTSTSSHHQRSASVPGATPR